MAEATHVEERVEQAGSDLGSVVESDGFRVESRSQGHSDEGLKATMREFLESEKKAAPDAKVTPAAQAEASPAPADETKPAADAPKTKVERRLDAIQQRIAEATKRAHAAESAALAAEERARTAEVMRRASEGQKTEPAPAEPSKAVAAPADDPRPRWSGDKGYEAQGKTFEQFEDDTEQWEARAEARRATALSQTTERLTDAQKAEREAAEQAERERFFDQRHRERHQALIADPEVAAAFESAEFQEMPATPFMTTLVKLHDKGGEVMKHFALNPAEGYTFSNLPLSREIKEAFRDSENPVGLISALVNDPEEAGRIANLSGTRAHRALWALEHGSGGAQGAPSPAVPRQLATPLPGKVQASRSVAKTKPTTELSTDDFDEFIRREEAGIS